MTTPNSLMSEMWKQNPGSYSIFLMLLWSFQNPQSSKFIQLISCFHLNDNKGSDAKEQDLVGAPWKITGVPEYESWQLGINEPPGNDVVLWLLLPPKFMWTLYSLFSKSCSFIPKLSWDCTVVNQICGCHVMVFTAYHPFTDVHQISFWTFDIIPESP